VGFYARYILPNLINLAMKNPETARLRSEWIPKARGEVLEIGIGSGLNLPFYTGQVRRVYGVDPSPELQRMARKTAAGLPLEVEFLLQPAEGRLPIAPESIDTVVLTWTLCSIANPQAAVGEMSRVLKRDGRLIFLEHGRAPDVSVLRWQDRLTPIWKRIAGGCHLNRKIDTILENAGFEISELTLGYLPGPRPLTYTYQGIATRAGQRRTISGNV
jgi:ubiquinone/menaquinone biosynthesis C-methylase UbiE